MCQLCYFQTSWSNVYKALCYPHTSDFFIKDHYSYRWLRLIPSTQACLCELILLHSALLEFMLSLTDIVSNHKQGSATGTSMKHCNTVSAEIQNMDLQTVTNMNRLNCNLLEILRLIQKYVNLHFFLISVKYINIKYGEASFPQFFFLPSQITFLPFLSFTDLPRN